MNPTDKKITTVTDAIASLDGIAWTVEQAQNKATTQVAAVAAAANPIVQRARAEAKLLTELVAVQNVANQLSVELAECETRFPPVTMAATVGRVLPQIVQYIAPSAWRFMLPALPGHQLAAIATAVQYEVARRQTEADKQKQLPVGERTMEASMGGNISFSPTM